MGFTGLGSPHGSWLEASKFLKNSWLLVPASLLNGYIVCGSRLLARGFDVSPKLMASESSLPHGYNCLWIQALGWRPPGFSTAPGSSPLMGTLFVAQGSWLEAYMFLQSSWLLDPASLSSTLFVALGSRLPAAGSWLRVPGSRFSMESGPPRGSPRL